MPLRALPPQGSASANFATWAVAPFPSSKPAGAVGEKYSRVRRPEETIARSGFGHQTPTMPSSASPGNPGPDHVPTKGRRDVTAMSTHTPAIAAHLSTVASEARASGLFAAVEVLPLGVVCEAKAPAAPAQYRVTVEGARWYVEVTTADRWLSHSIEADLLNTGDHLEDLVDEELVELGVTPLKAKVEHFRNDHKLFVFRSPLPGPDAAATALLAYEACFSRLGDMSAGAGDD
jgi:hypothetical protein